MRKNEGIAENLEKVLNFSYYIQDKQAQLEDWGSLIMTPEQFTHIYFFILEASSQGVKSGQVVIATQSTGVPMSI